MERPFLIDGICHPYNFSEENLKGRFGRIFNGVLYAFHPLLNPPETALSKDEWQHDWQNDEFLETIFPESDTDMACVHSTPSLTLTMTALSRWRRGRTSSAATRIAPSGMRRPTSSPASRLWSRWSTR